MAKSIMSKIFSTTFLLVLVIMISHTAESALLDLDITKADVGHNGNIVKVKPTHISVGKKGEGLARVDTKGVNVGKDGSIANVRDTSVFEGKPGKPTVDLGKAKVGNRQ